MLSNISRETILLVALALFGLGGLAFLQFGRKAPASRTENTSIVQTQTEVTSDAQTAAKYQAITGQILGNTERPEAGKPFYFELKMNVKGPSYELDFGDGSKRIPVENGRVKHVFQFGKKTYKVILYAKYDGEEVALDTLEQYMYPATKKDIKADVVDY